MIFVGTVTERIPGAKYAAQLSFAELTLRPPLPRAPTLRRQRHEQPTSVALALRAPRSALCSQRGPLRFDEAMEAGFAWLLAAADALDARAVVLPTPSDLTPGMRDSELLAAYAARLPRSEQRHWVWEPSGAWERERAEALSAELGLVLAFDPLVDPRPAGATAYARLRALGARRSFSQAALEQALVAVHGDDGEGDAFIAIDAPRSVQHALTLRQLIAGGLPIIGADAAASEDDEGDDDLELGDDADFDDEDSDDEDGVGDEDPGQDSDEDVEPDDEA
jgi:uncharacterized protein YecE (DUF72 family)